MTDTTFRTVITGVKRAGRTRNGNPILWVATMQGLYRTAPDAARWAVERSLIAAATGEDA